MKYSPATIANYFLDKASHEGRALTPMQILKLVYVAHGWYLGFRGEPLINEPVEAWQYGPVIRSLYRKVKKFGSSAVTEKLTTFEFPFGGVATVEDPKVASLLNNVWNGYGHFGGIKLSEMTHMKGSPWWKVWNDDAGHARKCAVIPDDVIRAFYEKKIEAHRDGHYESGTRDKAQQKRFESEARAVAEHQ
ncbi:MULTISPECIES: type II toxin-antitoxin system antitoxin SocA domain-containing protein [Stenotrophomonas]|uniref:Uncharacterized phage-associated protein n=1 Tax=Stenotrophomonas indicatrix TaxID=2045451 RepID=A0A1W1H483_9GAMM|nr:MULTISPECIES: type II toxin-antitoxin system antitoxin SocA domain-containing protein [Stenotrophomonas]MBD3827309.1 SocA family protein [Stenotrophomonas sp.]SLM26407.1 Uncharacterized phage-associated protein [Stenotrophomonas indicatrix]